MRVFLTGGSGWISSAVIPELTGAGHEVRALARSQASAAAVAAAGATAVPGDLDDLDGLRAAAKDSDGVVHLGFTTTSPTSTGHCAPTPAPSTRSPTRWRAPESPCW